MRLGPISGGVVCLSPGPMMRCCAGRRPSSLSAPSSRRLLSLPAFPQAPRRLFTSRKYDRLYVNLTVCLRERALRRGDGGGWRRVSRARASEPGFQGAVLCGMCGRWTRRHWQHAPPGMKESSKFAAPVEKEKKMFNFQTNVNLTALLFFCYLSKRKQRPIHVGKLSSVHEGPRVRHFIAPNGQKASCK